MYKLIIEDDEGRTTVVPFVKDEITIGRKEGNTIRLTERNVSRHHARLGRVNGSIFVEDLDSYNGVKVNGDRITARTTLREGDLVEIGDYHLALQKAEQERDTLPSGAVAAPPPRPQGRTGVPAPTTADGGTAVLRLPVEDRPPLEPSRSRPLASQEAGRLVITTTELAGQTFTLDKSEMTIGRTEDNDIVVPHRSVSSRHAKIVHDDGTYRVIDMDSANGVLVNGEEYARVDIRKGDVIELGHVKFQYHPPGESAPSAVLQAPAPAALPRAMLPRAMVDAADAEARSGGAGLGKKLGLGLGVVAVLGLGTFLVLHFTGYRPVGPEAADAGPGPGESPDKGAGPGVTARPATAELFQRGLEHMKTAEWGAAEKSYREVLALEPDHKAATAMLEKVTAEQAAAGSLEKAKKAIEDKDWDAAWDSINEVSEGSQAFQEASRLRAEVQRKYSFHHLNKADLLEKGGKKSQLEEAVKHLDTVLLVDPGNYMAQEKRRKLQARLAGGGKQPPPPGVAPDKPRPPVAPPGEDRVGAGKTKRAADQRAAEQFEKAMAAFKKKQFREANTLLQETYKLTPTNHELLRQIGTCYVHEGKVDKAYEYYRKYVQLCPKCMYAPKVREMINQYEASLK